MISVCLWHASFIYERRASFTCMNTLHCDIRLQFLYWHCAAHTREDATRNSHRNAQRNPHQESKNYCSRSLFRFWNEKRPGTIVSWFRWGFRFAFRRLFRVICSETGCTTIRRNASCRTYEWVMSLIWMSHVAQMNELCHVHKQTSLQYIVRHAV